MLVKHSYVGKNGTVIVFGHLSDTKIMLIPEYSLKNLRERLRKQYTCHIEESKSTHLISSIIHLPHLFHHRNIQTPAA